MEDLYSIHPGIIINTSTNRGGAERPEQEEEEVIQVIIEHEHEEHEEQEVVDLKAQIASHPRYPSLLSAYVQCRKVGAPPEMASMLEDIVRERCAALSLNSSSCIASHAHSPHPDLDTFMDTYCQVLMRYKEELSKPFDEAASFLTTIQTQLTNLCTNSNNKGYTATSSPAAPSTTLTTASSTALSDEFMGSSDEDPCLGDVDEISELHEPGSGSSSGTRLVDNELKVMLLKKYSGYLSHLRKEFMKKRKKGKLPRDARSTLLDWWSTHYRWPYPTEEDKVRLASMTGLVPKQINNWFINQRKRHWKPSEDMRFALMEGVSAGSSGTTTLYFDTGTIGP